MAVLTEDGSSGRFRHHVSFDNIPVGEATKNNVLGYTINLTHDGYQPKRRSRTMMAGVDQHFYSDYALQWLLEEYAEDGDEVICVHVSERDSRDDKNYKPKAQAMVERIKQKIPPDCAISIKLEYAVGKLHETFQKLVCTLSFLFLVFFFFFFFCCVKSHHLAYRVSSNPY